VTDEDRWLASSDLDEWQTLVEGLETREDMEIAKDTYAQLEAAGGERARAGWLKWDDVREDFS